MSISEVTVERRSSAGEAVAALECKGVSKSFPGVQALKDVSLRVEAAQIHAFVGQNGAGKSTLVKVLTGAYAPSAGTLSIDGTPVRFSSPADAEAKGIVIVHQDQQMVGQFDVVRNIFLGRELTSHGVLDFPRMRSAADDALRQVGASFSSSSLIRDLTVAERALVAIAAALTRNPKILILDEPTASLSEAEAENLFLILRGLKTQGVTIIYISHYLDEIFELVDRISVLRDGRLISTSGTDETTRNAVIDAMVGRPLSHLYPKEDLSLGGVALSVKGLSQGNRVRNVSFDVRQGEIFGIAGLVGSGRTELAMALFGDAKREGTVEVFGSPSKPKSPRAAKRDGFALIPEDRRHEGLVTDLSMRENLSLPGLARFAQFGWLSGSNEMRWVGAIIDQLKIVPPNPAQTTRNLSGGNQQKVVIGRWLGGGGKVFIFDEPTTGVDVGSKVEIYKQMTEIARSGAVVIFISSDFEELLGMCDRVGIMHKGNLVDIRPASQLDVPGVLELVNSGSGRKEDPSDEGKVHGGRQLGPILTRWGTAAGMLIVLAAISMAAPDFIAWQNLFDVLKQGSVLAFVALGVTAALVAGGFDMSAGAVSQLSTNLAAGFIGSGFGIATGLGIGVGAGLCAGAFNALMVLLFRIPPFVATLGTMFVTMGLALVYNKGQALTLSDQPAFFFIGQGHIGPIPFIFILLLAVVGLLHILFKFTRAGLRMYAVGQNQMAAHLRGVSRLRAVSLSLVTAGIIFGLAGVILASYSYGASALATGFDFLIFALAASLLGTGLSRTGELSVIGTTFAAVFLAALANGLVLIGISALALPGIQGAILLVSILLGVIHKRGIGQVAFI